MQESILFVLGDLLGVLWDCNQRIILCLNQVGGTDNGSGTKGKSS
jgi:hypothetical protein